MREEADAPAKTHSMAPAMTSKTVRMATPMHSKMPAMAEMMMLQTAVSALSRGEAADNAPHGQIGKAFVELVNVVNGCRFSI